jgi:hypothetical protein
MWHYYGVPMVLLLEPQGCAGIELAMNSAKGLISPRELAAARAAIYSGLRSILTTVHGYPPDASIAFIRNRPNLPLPSI